MPKEQKKSDDELKAITTPYERNSNFLVRSPNPKPLKKPEYKLRLFLRDGELYYSNGEKYRRRNTSQDDNDCDDCRGCVML